jgi:ABC-type Fe3+ transport system permease subunit
VSIYWHLPILIVVVSLVYSATRHDSWDKIVREAVHWGVRMTTFLVAIGVVLFALSTFL